MLLVYSHVKYHFTLTNVFKKIIIQDMTNPLQKKNINILILENTINIFS